MTWYEILGISISLFGLCLTFSDTKDYTGAASSRQLVGISLVWWPITLTGIGVIIFALPFILIGIGLGHLLDKLGILEDE